MIKNLLLKIVNPVLFVLFLLQVATGLGAGRFAFARTIHGFTGLLLVVVGLTHILLNWGWIHQNLFKHVEPAPAGKK